MNIQDRVHLAPQDSLCLNSLTVLCWSHNELKRIGTYYRPTINNDVGYGFVLGDQQPDCYKGRGHPGHADDSAGFKKRVVGRIHFYPLRAGEVPSPQKMISLEQLRSALKSKRSDSVSVDRY